MMRSRIHPKVCEWGIFNHEDELWWWETECGGYYKTRRDNMKDEKFTFCPRCSKTILEIKHD